MPKIITKNKTITIVKLLTMIDMLAIIIPIMMSLMIMMVTMVMAIMTHIIFTKKSEIFLDEVGNYSSLYAVITIIFFLGDAITFGCPDF